MTKTQKIVYYVLLVLISALFIVASLPKLTSQPEAIQGFQMAHLPIWFMYFIGVCEILGVIGLWINPLRKYAAAGLFIILAGAVVTTAVFISVTEAIFPLVAMIVLGFVVKLGNKPAVVAVQQ